MAGTAAGTGSGFTLLELVIVVSVLAVIAAIALPNYDSALQTARIGKAKHDLVAIANTINTYKSNHGGRLPLTLHQVGFGGRLDPWGLPYCYFNYGDGTGDGLEWAIDAGLVDPNAVIGMCEASGGSGAGAPAGGGHADGGDPHGGGPPHGGSGGATPRRAVPLPQSPRAFQQVSPRSALARGAVAQVRSRMSRALTPFEEENLEATLTTEAGEVAMFAGVARETTRRRDGFMYPLNSDYDLFSLGPDGRTAVALGQPMARDDVIRANNGGFFGLASDY
jgi:general secretion pathway protein G